MADNNKKSGFTVSEIESKVKKFGTEISLCVIFVLTAVFALIWGGGMLTWSVILCMLLAIVSALLPKAMHKVTTSAFGFITKEKVTSIIVGVIAVLVSIFLPAVIFALVGLMAGKSFSHSARGFADGEPED